MLSVEDLSISFGGLAALSGLGFEVAEREIFALIGPNGAGKSTVFNVVTGLYRPSSGRVRFLGEDLLALAPHEIARRGVARTFQNTEVFRTLTALDNVLIGRHTHLRSGALRGALAVASVRREEAAARGTARALLERLGLGEVAGVEAGSLPLGFQKRLELARALASEPRLLLLDEPAGGLNPTETQALMEVIVRLRDEHGLTILVVEHDMELVMGISDRVAVLNYGRKIAEGKPDRIAADPAVIEAYLGSEDD
ncbi:MAG: ABC transporter ATP-binding protein [Candidatus Rokubacteria bacterium]|nr:ABC transporter ATP-binding protein [Candidatus Rokubacteria bacterium]